MTTKLPGAGLLNTTTWPLVTALPLSNPVQLVMVTKGALGSEAQEKPMVTFCPTGTVDPLAGEVIVSVGSAVQFWATIKSENPLLLPWVPGSLRVCVKLSMMFCQLLVPMGAFRTHAPVMV